MTTVTKRASALNVACPWRSVLPFAADSNAVAERMTLAYLYGGIDTTSAVIGTTGEIVRTVDRGRIVGTRDHGRIVRHVDRGRIVTQRGT
jgi:hypothetical protein